ncbi:hypothetical protein ABW19_dt0207774 [Dactylella cylindrospora]|nr:hypothetical protein ABW19_dt0207774 [Dactylella cylindrospora]
MSTATDSTAKPAEEFVVYTEDNLAEGKDKTTPNPLESKTVETVLSLDTKLQEDPGVNRADSFPRTLPLPASSILSPNSATLEKSIPSLNEEQIPPAPEDVISPPETETTAAGMYIQTENNLSPAADEARAQTPLAELAGTAFDQQVAVKRRAGSIVGEEISDNLAELKVEDEATPVVKKAPVKEPLDAEALKARRDDPAIVASLPQTPSAEDFEVAKSHEGAKFDPEYPNETKVAS